MLPRNAENKPESELTELNSRLRKLNFWVWNFSAENWSQPSQKLLNKQAGRHEKGQAEDHRGLNEKEYGDQSVNCAEQPVLNQRSVLLTDIKHQK